MRTRVMVFVLSGLVTAPALRAGAAQRAEPEQVVVLDSWFNVDHAKAWCRQATTWYKSDRGLIAQLGCEAVTSCPELMPVVQACQLNDAAVEVHDFEDRMMTYFASDPRCAPIHVVRYAGPNSDNSGYKKFAEAHWTLFLDYRPGARKQNWDLQKGLTNSSMKGEGDPLEIAGRVCSIVTARGAKVN